MAFIPLTLPSVSVLSLLTFTKKNIKDSEIIAMEHSFHGRSTGSLAVTGNENYRKDFMPLMSGVKFATFNDLTSLFNQGAL